MVTGESYGGWYRSMRDRLTKAGCDSPAFDALCLLEDIAGLPKGGLPLWKERPLPPETAARLEAAVAQREKRRPLQYILGRWPFLDLTLEVGEGVLIPRPDTELLCESAADWLKGRPQPRVLDLCAGSGCVGLGIARLCPGARVTAVELSQEALPYLRRNAARYPQYALTVKAGDALDPGAAEGLFDAVVSNPPYIPADELEGLMPEVRREPRMALDGGDGLRFYRGIARIWVPRLQPGGFCAVEVGVGQAADVAALFRAAGLDAITVRRDLGGIERVVAGFRPA